MIALRTCSLQRTGVADDRFRPILDGSFGVLGTPPPEDRTLRTAIDIPFGVIREGALAELGRMPLPVGQRHIGANAARFQLDIMGVPGLIVARTDAEAASLLDSAAD